MKMNSARKLASKVLNVGTSRVRLNPLKLKEVSSAITGEDIKSLVKDGAFEKVGQGHSRGRARVLAIKKKNGRKRGQGKRKGTKAARVDTKLLWLRKVRSQRLYIKDLLTKGEVDRVVYRDLYRKVKGGFFRSKSHIQSFLQK